MSIYTPIYIYIHTHTYTCMYDGNDDNNTSSKRENTRMCIVCYVSAQAASALTPPPPFLRPLAPKEFLLTRGFRNLREAPLCRHTSRPPGREASPDPGSTKRDGRCS